MTLPLDDFVAWFREASPYIHAHRDRTFVICFDGAAVDSPDFRHLIHDIALLHSLGARIVVVHGTRTQIDRCQEAHGLPRQIALGMRITDSAAMECVKTACGQIMSDIQALLSMALSNVPYSHSRIRAVSGNFITARPVGVRQGIDFLHTGEVRNIDRENIEQLLDQGYLVLISPLGYSLTGEAFNLTVEEVASAVAGGLAADKWICLAENDVPRDAAGTLLHELQVREAQDLVATTDHECLRRQLHFAIRACHAGVKRVHLLDRRIDGGLLLELFSRDGVGTMISHAPFDHIRRATLQDVGGLLELIAPLEEQGVLARRTREKLEQDIHAFHVLERDHTLIACAALYPYPEQRSAELACVAIHPAYQGEGRGGELLDFMERQARQRGLETLFVLTTQSAHWFRDRGFAPAEKEKLPAQKQAEYNLRRNSQVYAKRIG